MSLGKRNPGPRSIMCKGPEARRQGQAAVAVVQDTKERGGWWTLHAFDGFRLKFWFPFVKLSDAITTNVHLLKKSQ